ncbi:MAG: serine hydrolase domain-containing protein, partial [Lysobacter sp.]
RKYSDLARELAFRPLRMKHSSVELSPKIMAHAAQGHGENGEPVPMRYYAEQAPSTLTTSVNDFARWMSAGMYSADGVDGALPRAVLQQMYRPAELSTPRAADADVYGMGHFIESLADGSLAVGHNGRNQAGFRANFLMRPERRDGIVFLSNSRTGLALDRVICLWKADAGGADPAVACKQ